MNSYKYIAIDGHGRANFFEEAFSKGAIVGNKQVPPGDPMFMKMNVLLLDDKVTSEARSKICISYIAQNQDSVKVVTEVGTYVNFHMLF